MKEKNKGFTLVELLAVIVILALIALIATPIILNVINDAKKQAAKDSAYGYMDAVEKYIVSSELEDKSIQDGTYRVEELNKKISVKGSTPDNGNIEIKNSSVKSYDIGIDGYVVRNGKVDKVSTTKSFKNGTAVYYNPETENKCSKEASKSTTGTKSGCMKWYVFNDKEGNATVNVILDHNTTANVAWNSTGNNSEMKEVKKALENDTKDWKNTARLITANEIAKITGNTGFDASKEKQEKSIVSRFPLVNKKLLSFGKKQKQTNAILRKLDQVIVEEVCEEVWKSNKLTKSHLGIVKKGTHAKGEMSLGKGQYRQIDQFTYFRDTVFRDLDWKNNKSGDEIANAYFTMIICGINYGEYKLRILHKRKGMVAYQQNNYVTSIRWGDVSHLLKNENLLGRELVIYKTSDKERYVIDIE